MVDSAAGRAGRGINHLVLDELRPGLWRWTARHPDAEEDPDPGGPDDWGPDVGCVACAAPGALVVIDPLVPAGQEEPFFARMDELVARHGPRVAVLTTIGFRRRSRAAFGARYGATTSRGKAALPAGVRTVPIRRAGEVMVWLEEHRALVPRERLLGGDARGGRLWAASGCSATTRVACGCARCRACAACRAG